MDMYWVFGLVVVAGLIYWKRDMLKDWFGN
jgi:hypothetical protein